MTYRAALMTLWILVLVVGCESAKEPPSDSVASSSKDRPALRICVVDAPLLQKEIELRWQAISDQPIKIENLTAREAMERETLTADVVIYPEILLGDLVEDDKIGKLPKQHKNSAIGLNESEKSPVPKRWRHASSYGAQEYAAVLGSPNFVSVAKGFDSDDLIALHKSIESNEDLSKQSIDRWNAFLDKAEKAVGKKDGDREDALNTRLKSLSNEEQDWLVDRYLYILATTEAKRRGLFDLVRLQSRVGQPEFIEAARVLARLVRLFPNTFLSSPTDAWEQTKKEKVSFAIGWPRTDGSEDQDSEDDSTKIATSILPFVWNPNHGLNVSIGRRSRQTAVSTQFIYWIAEFSQRESLHALTPYIELLPDEQDQNLIREDFRGYQKINNQELRFDTNEVSFRFKPGKSYRDILASTIVQVVSKPERAPELLSECNRKWNDVTKSLNVDKLRQSIEHSYGYGQ